MTTHSPFVAASRYEAQATVEVSGVALPAHFSEPAAEYERAKQQAALFDRSDRGLIRLTGNDRKPWLHNLVTNAVKTLDPGAGNYAFATSVKGRVLFDLNILEDGETTWLDLDRAALPAAMAHFDRYLITEDVDLADATVNHDRLACCGPGAAEIAGRLGVTNLGALPDLGCTRLSAEDAWLFRHDLTGQLGFELVVPAGGAAAWWDRLVEHGAQPAGWLTLDVLRIEAGIPVWGRDIDDRTLPPETRQIERGINYHKGCYLGQEVIERMRAYGSLAKRLVRVELDAEAAVEPGTELFHDGNKAGRVTSLVRHPVSGRRIGLGYLKTAVTTDQPVTAGEPPQAVQIRELS